MKERMIFQCEYCRKIRLTKEAMERHEIECIHNPLSINCYRCTHAYEGEVYSSEGYSTRWTGACCNYIEDNIGERMAHKCDEFTRSETPWYMRKGESEASSIFKTINS